jgi:hypothetical protein
MEVTGDVSKLDTRTDTKGRQQPAKRTRDHSRARLHREMKLGSDTVAKIKGTSLDHADEMDELIKLKRSSKLAPIAEHMIERAAAGETMSAVAYTKRGAAFRFEDIGPASSGAREDMAVRLKHAESQNIVLRSKIRELTAALANKLAAVSNAKFLAELERRLPPQFLKTHHAAMKAIACELDASHTGSTLDLKTIPVVEATKH